MATHTIYEEKTEAILEPIASKNGVKIYDVEYIKEAGTYYLRCYIDKDGGVTIDDCEKVSRELSDALDKDDFISDIYILEVSSPGLGRQLKKDRHFANSIGQMIDVKLFEQIDGSKEFSGILKSFDKDNIFITTEDGAEYSFERTKISKTNLTMIL